MLSPRGKKIIFLLLALLIIVSGALWLRGHLQGRHELAQARLQLDSPHADTRLDAARTLLHYEPSHIEARLIHAKEMLQRGNFVACRQDVQALPDNATPQQLFEGTLLAARSFIGQAQLTVLNAPARGVDTIAGQVEELLAQTVSLRQIVESTPDQDEIALTLHAMETDVRAFYLRAVLQSIHDTLGPTRSAVSAEQVQVLGVQTSDDQSELARLETQLTDLCGQILTINPHATEPLALLFRQQLRQGKLDEARQTADRLARQEQLSVRLILSAVNELLKLEDRYRQEITSEDLALIRKLLDRTPAVDADRVEVHLAVAELALMEHQYERAAAVLNLAMTRPDYTGHVHGICLRGRALMGLGKYRDAEQLLARLNDRQPTWEGKLVQGLAMQADRRQGLDLLRQAQELAPRSLPVRLAICQAIVATGGVAVAELDIAELARLAPQHSRVMDLRLKLAVHQGQRATIHEYLSQYDQPGHVALRPEHAVLLALMVLDDAPAIDALSQHLHQGSRHDPLALMGLDWAGRPAIARAEAARFAAQTLRDVLDAQPLRRPGPPAFAAWDRRRQRQALELLGEVAQPTAQRILSGSVYLAWPYETALEVVEAGHHRWPADASLPQVAARLALWLGRTDQAHRWLALHDQKAADAPLGKAIAAWLAGDMDALQGELAIAGDDAAVGQSLSQPDWPLLRLLVALRQRDMMAVATELRSLLVAHPRAEPAMLWVLRELDDAADAQQLDMLISQMRSAAPDLVQMTQARLMIARNLPVQGTRSLNLVSTEALNDSIIRWQQTELEVVAARWRDQPLVALGALETLALSIPAQSPLIHVAEVDLMVDMGRDHTAASILQQQLLTSPLWPAQWLDELLARAMVLLEPTRLMQMLDQLLVDHPDHGLLLDYRARLLMALGHDSQADAALATLVGHHPDAPRTLMLQARRAMDQGRMDEARHWLRQVVEQGGPATPIASRYLDQMIAASQTPLPQEVLTP